MIAKTNNNANRLSPIVLFVYKRPQHTLQALEALCKNKEASESILYIYADGPKVSSSEKDRKNVQLTREVIRSKKWCMEVFIIEAEYNNGLANSVIKGTSEIVNKYGTVITLEDDVIVSSSFLEYMNRALNLYSKNDRVWMVSGYYWPVQSSSPKCKCFFLSAPTTQAWGTWKRAWSLFDINSNGYEELLTSKSLKKKFNLGNSYDFATSLISQVEEQKTNSWAIRFWWSMFKKNGLILFPDKSLIKNIGWDGSGENCGESVKYNDKNWQMDYQIKHFPSKIRINRKQFRLVKNFHRKLVWIPKENLKMRILKSLGIIKRKLFKISIT